GRRTPARKERAQACEDRGRSLAVELLVDDRLSERGENARRRLKLHAKRPDLVDDAREHRIRGAQVHDGEARIKAKHTVAIQERLRAIQLGAFDGEHAALGYDASLGGKAADLTAGGEYAVARHDDREWISPERLSHSARGTRCADPRRNVAIGQCHARRNGTRDLVDAAV